MRRFKGYIAEYKEKIRAHLEDGPYFHAWLLGRTRLIAINPRITDGQRGERLRAFFEAMSDLEDESN